MFTFFISDLKINRKKRWNLFCSTRNKFGKFKLFSNEWFHQAQLWDIPNIQRYTDVWKFCYVQFIITFICRRRKKSCPKLIMRQCTHVFGVCVYLSDMFAFEVPVRIHRITIVQWYIWLVTFSFYPCELFPPYAFFSPVTACHCAVCVLVFTK